MSPTGNWHAAPATDAIVSTLRSAAAIVATTVRAFVAQTFARVIMVSLHPWRVSLFRRPRDGNGRRHLAIKNDEVLIDAAGTTARRVRKPRRS